MRSTPWTAGVHPTATYELRDADGRALGQTDSHVEAKRMLLALVLTGPGRESDLYLVSLSANGREILREDVFDVELDLLSQ